MLMRVGRRVTGRTDGWKQLRDDDPHELAALLALELIDHEERRNGH